ncbi:MAG: flagellar hook-associated protein 3, partial [Spirochaetaceae bacterium]|nr:flagellar hook-associated protein 3 [Spirochaetaceae bacterium]
SWMQRVSTDTMNGDMQFWLRRTERDMAKAENGLARQERIENLRDDPLGAARAVRYESVVGRLERYEKNAAWAGDQYKVSEAYVREALDVTQRLREIAVQGANGVYTKDDQKHYMAIEVEELVKELVAIGNAKGPDGAYVFSGDKSRTEPFRVVSGSSPAAGREVIQAVQYLGGSGGAATEVTEGSTIPLSQSGSEIFWAERQTALSGYDARDWRAREDARILVDGKSVEIKAGDTVHAVAAKINDSGAAVKASIDPRRFSLSLEATVPHEMRLEDGREAGADAAGGGGGRPGVLEELGLLSGSGLPGQNWAPSARVTGGSLFDVALRLRDSLHRGDVIETGGLSLAGIDAGIDGLTRRAAELGSRSERLDMVQVRLNREIPDTTKLLANEKDLDLTRAITDFRMMEYAHKASLGFAGRLFPQTLLDFLR